MDKANQEVDLAVIGAGVAGISAAVRASELNAKVCLIEKERVGGACFFRHLYPFLKVLQAQPENEDFPSLVGLLKETANKISTKWRERLINSGVQVKDGIGSFLGPEKVHFRSTAGDEEVIQAKNVLFATGSRPSFPATIPHDGSYILSSEDILELKKIPPSVMVWGGGKFGCETAVFLNRLGSKVFLCDENSHLLPGHDPDLHLALETILKRLKIKLLLNKKILSIYKDKDKVDIALGDEVKFSASALIMAGSRKAQTADLGLERSSIRLGEHGEILADDAMATSLPGIFAAGSVTGRKISENISGEQGKVAAENALGKNKSLNEDWVPLTVHTQPEIASVGCFAEEAHHKGFRGVEGRCDFSALDHSLLHQETLGFYKVAADKASKRIIGGQIVSKNASEMIPVILLAIKKGLTVNSLAQLTSGWGTEFQGIREAARACSQALK